MILSYNANCEVFCVASHLTNLTRLPDAHVVK